MDKKELLEQLEQAQTEANDYNFDKAIAMLYDIANILCFYSPMDDIIDIETAEEKAKEEIDNGGLVRLYYFMGDVNFNTCGDYIRINAYGNLEEIDKTDIGCIIDEYKDYIETNF